MSAEVSSDLTLIQDEDILRRMWADTEDFGRKKEIRARMYKLREQRLKDFYTTGEVVTEITGRKHATTTHTESIGDQGFLTMKTKEIRDSESPTREFSRGRGNNGYWTSVEERGYSSGTHDGTSVERKEESNKGEGVVIEGNTETKMALSAHKLHEKSEKSDENMSVKSDRSSQSQSFSSKSVKGTADNALTTAEISKQSAIHSSKEEKTSQSTSSSRTTKFSSATTSSSSKKVVSSSSQSYQVIGDQKTIKDTEVKAITDGRDITETGLRSEVRKFEDDSRETSSVKRDHTTKGSVQVEDLRDYSNENLRQTYSTENQRSNQTSGTSRTTYTTKQTNVSTTDQQNTDNQSRQTNLVTSVIDDKSDVRDRSDINIIREVRDISDLNVTRDVRDRSDVQVTRDVLDRSDVRDRSDVQVVNDARDRNEVREKSAVHDRSDVHIKTDVYDRNIKQDEIIRVTRENKKNIIDSNEFITNEKTETHDYERPEKRPDSDIPASPSGGQTPQNDSVTNRKILTEIHKLDTYLHNQQTPASSEPATPKGATDGASWTVVSNQGGEFIYQDDKTTKETTRTHGQQPKEQLVKHPSSLDLPKEATEGQYVTTYQQSYNRISVDNSPSHEFFVRTLRASPDRLTPSPTKSSRGSLDRNSPDRRVRAPSKGSLDRCSPETNKWRSVSKGSLDRRSPDRPKRTSQPSPEKERRGSSESYTVDRRKSSRRKTTEITQSTLKDTTAKTKRKFSSTQQKAANKNRISTPGVSPSTSPTRSARVKETTSESESDASHVTYNKTTSLSSFHDENVNTSKQDVRTQSTVTTQQKNVTDSKWTKPRDKSPEYSSEGSVSRELRKTTEQQTRITEGSAFRPIKTTTEKVDNEKFIEDEKKYIIEEIDNKGSTETITIERSDREQTTVRDVTEDMTRHTSKDYVDTVTRVVDDTNRPATKDKPTNQSSRPFAGSPERKPNDNKDTFRRVETTTVRKSTSEVPDRSPKRPSTSPARKSSPHSPSVSPDRKPGTSPTRTSKKAEPSPSSSPERKHNTTPTRTSKVSSPERKPTTLTKTSKQSASYSPSTSPERKPSTKTTKPPAPYSPSTSPERKPSTKSSAPYSSTSPERRPSTKTSKPTAPYSPSTSPERKPSAKTSKSSAPFSPSTSPERKPATKTTKPSIPYSSSTSPERKPSPKSSTPYSPTSPERKRTTSPVRTSKKTTPRSPSSSPERKVTKPSREAKPYSPSVSPDRRATRDETTKIDETTTITESRRRSVSSSPSPDRRHIQDTTMSSQAFISEESRIITDESRIISEEIHNTSPTKKQSPQQKPTERRPRPTSYDTKRAVNSSRPGDRARQPEHRSGPQRRRPPSPSSSPERVGTTPRTRRIPEPKYEKSPSRPLRTAQDSTYLTTHRVTQKTTAIKDVQNTPRSTSIPRANKPYSPTDSRVRVETTTTTVTKTSPTAKRTAPQSRTRDNTSVTRTVTRQTNVTTDLRKPKGSPTSPTKPTATRRPTDQKSPSSRKTLIPSSPVSKTSSTSKTTQVRGTSVVQKTTQSRISAQRVNEKRTIRNKTENTVDVEEVEHDSPDDGTVTVNKQFIIEERKDYVDLEDENPPDEFYAEYDSVTDEGSPERRPRQPVKQEIKPVDNTEKPQDRTRKPAVPGKAPNNLEQKPQQQSPKKISQEKVDSLRTSQTVHKESVNTKKSKTKIRRTSTSSTSSSSEDEAIEIVDEHEVTSEVDGDIHTPDKDHLKVVVQQPKSSRESSPGYPSAGVPFCTTSDDGESNPRYADFISEPEDVEVFDKHLGPGTPIRITEEVDSPTVADRINVFLENTRNTQETTVQEKEIITGKPKSVLKTKTLFENIAKTQKHPKATDDEPLAPAPKPKPTDTYRTVVKKTTEIVEDDTEETDENVQVTSTTVIDDTTNIQSKNAVQPEDKPTPTSQPKKERHIVEDVKNKEVLKTKTLFENISKTQKHPKATDVEPLTPAQKPKPTDTYRTVVKKTTEVVEDDTEETDENFEITSTTEIDETIDTPSKNLVHPEDKPTPTSQPKKEKHVVEYVDKRDTSEIRRKVTGPVGDIVSKKDFFEKQVVREQVDNRRTDYTSSRNLIEEEVRTAEHQVRETTQRGPIEREPSPSPETFDEDVIDNVTYDDTKTFRNKEISEERVETVVSKHTQNEQPKRRITEKSPSPQRETTKPKPKEKTEAKKPFERKPSGPVVDVSSKKNFFERKVQDITESVTKSKKPLPQKSPTSPAVRRPSAGSVKTMLTEDEQTRRESTEESYMKATVCSTVRSHSPDRITESPTSERPDHVAPPKTPDIKRSTRPDDVQRRPSKPEEIVRKVSKPEEIVRKTTQTTEITRKISRESPERKFSKPEEITRYPKKPEEIVRKPSKTEEVIRKHSRQEEVQRKSSRPDDITKTALTDVKGRQTSEEVTKKASKFEELSRKSSKTDVINRETHVTVSITDETSRTASTNRKKNQDIHTKSTTGSTSRGQSPEKLPEEVRRRPTKTEEPVRTTRDQEQLQRTTRVSETQEKIYSRHDSDLRTKEPSPQRSAPTRQSPDDREEEDDTQTKYQTTTESFMRSTRSSSARETSPGKVSRTSTPDVDRHVPQKVDDSKRTKTASETVTVTTSSKVVEDKVGGKFGVTLRKTPSANKIITKITTVRQQTKGDVIDIESIFDLELLEQMLLKAVGYDDRRAIRAQIRLVKKQIEEEKNSAVQMTIRNTHVTSVNTNLPSVKDIKRVSTPDKRSSPDRGHRQPTSTRTTPTSDQRRPGTGSPDRKYTASPERSPDRKPSSTDRRQAYSPDRKPSTGDRRQAASPDRKAPAERRYTPTEGKHPSPDRSPTRRASHDRVTTGNKESRTVYETTTSTVHTQSTRRSSGAEPSPTDLITSSYGVGPTDENGKPLFGLKALRRTSTNKALLDDEREEGEVTFTEQEESSLFGLRALQADNMPAESSQLRELVERHQQYVKESSTKEFQPIQKPKAKLRDSFILTKEEEEASAITQSSDDSNKGLSLKSIIQKHDNSGTTVKSSMESTSTVIKSHSSISSDGKVSLHRDVIHGEVSSKNGEEPAGKITRSSYSYKSPNNKESQPSIKSSTTTSLIGGGRRNSGPKIEEIADSSTVSSETSRRFSKDYTIEEDEDRAVERRRSSGLSVEENVKKYTSILKNSTNSQNVDTRRRSSGPKITDISDLASDERDVQRVAFSKNTVNKGVTDIPNTKTVLSNFKNEESKTESTKKVITRGDSVKALQHKFQQATVSSSLKQSVERTDSKSRVQERKDTKVEESTDSQSERSERKVTVHDRSEAVKTTQQITRSEEPTSFLDNRTKVTGVQDILTRMRNADLVSESTDTVEDAEARSLLNKFLGASVILQGMEQGMRSTHHTEIEESATPPASASLVIQVEKQRVKATSDQSVEDDIDEITDEKQLRILLDACSDYEGRRKLRARLRTIMAEQKGGAEDAEESLEQSESSEITRKGDTIVKREVFTTRTTSSSAKLTKANSVQSPFAKFKQLERHNSAPRTYK